MLPEHFFDPTATLRILVDVISLNEGKGKRAVLFRKESVKERLLQQACMGHCFGLKFFPSILKKEASFLNKSLVLANATQIHQAKTHPKILFSRRLDPVVMNLGFLPPTLKGAQALSLEIQRPDPTNIEQHK